MKIYRNLLYRKIFYTAENKSTKHKSVLNLQREIFRGRLQKYFSFVAIAQIFVEHSMQYTDSQLSLFLVMII